MTELISKEIPQHLKCHVTSCGREVGKMGDLVCPAHGKLLPRLLRVTLNRYQGEVKKRTGSKREKMANVIGAAAACLAYLDAMKIQLPSASVTP